MHWACSKITASLAIPDVTLLEILLDKVFVFFLIVVYICPQNYRLFAHLFSWKCDI